MVELLQDVARRAVEEGGGRVVKFIGDAVSSKAMISLMRLISRIEEDKALSQAPRAAYYFFLSLFPLILVIFALTGLLGGDAAFVWVMKPIQESLPPAAAAYLAQYVEQVTGQDRPAVLTIGLLLTLWSASAGVLALGDGLNVVYGIQRSRPWWKRRVLALALLASGSILFLLGATAILAGPPIAESLRLGLVWKLLSVPIGLLPLVSVIWFVYYVLPNRDASHAKKAVLAGAISAALLWVAISYIFRLYVVTFGSYDLTYGAVGAIIVLMLWFQFTALAFMLGAEVSAFFEARVRRDDTHA